MVTSDDPTASPTTVAVPARRLSRSLSTCASVSVRCDEDGRSAIGCGRAFCTVFALVEPADLAGFRKAGFSVGILETSRSPLEASPADMDCCLSKLPPPSKTLSSLPPILRRTESNYVSSLYLRLPECRRVTTYGATMIRVIVRGVSPAVPLIQSYVVFGLLMGCAGQVRACGRAGARGAIARTPIARNRWTLPRAQEGGGSKLTNRGQA